MLLGHRRPSKRSATPIRESRKQELGQLSKFAQWKTFQMLFGSACCQKRGEWVPASAQSCFHCYLSSREPWKTKVSSSSPPSPLRVSRETSPEKARTTAGLPARACFPVGVFGTVVCVRTRGTIRKDRSFTLAQDVTHMAFSKLANQGAGRNGKPANQSGFGGIARQSLALARIAYQTLIRAPID